MDHLTVEKRSENMAKIKSKDSKAELIVRKRLHALGFRYRLHSKILIGKPDIVLAKYKAVIFVHGCFWHRHNCKRATIPKSNTEYWDSKFKRNIDRFKEVSECLKKNGWNVFVIWECEVKDFDIIDKISMQIKDALKI
ncbi:MAG: DNA mismatch endonuclease Vsr [bacterium]|nr:DNA mismatch endonuclease Vsr [bacterium]